jgi:LPS-assembly protein
LQDKKLVDSLVGLEYKDNCWSFRLVGQRFATATNTSTTSFFIQLELNGLSKLGSNPIDVLKKNISGYQPIN